MKPTGSFYQVQIKELQSDHEELASQLCFDAGASGVSQDLEFSQPDLVYEAEVVKTPKIQMSAFFEAPPPSDLVEQLMTLDPTAIVMLVEKPNEDWMEGWKKHFKAFLLVEPYWVVPSWLQAPPEAKKTLSIDPGMAFGTGTHATTQIASRMILEHLKNHQVKSALDVGTGTAILAMLLAKEGVSVVDATEIDPMARETGIENLKLNGLSQVTVYQEQIESLTSTYDFVIANIIDGILVRLREDLYRLTNQNGYILVTGILDERKSDFLLRFPHLLDLELVREVNLQEWWGFLFRKKS